MYAIQTAVTSLFNIRYPVIQGGMIWCAGWELAAAVSNNGGLGLIGSGSMDPDTLRIHIRKAREATAHPFGVNVPLIYSHAADNIRVIMEEKVPVVFTSAGNPAQWTSQLKEAGILVAHVVANLRFAQKAADAGVDAVVVEGFEAGGHNGREETTTMVLVPRVSKHLSIPVIAAGGVASGEAMLAALALGAEGVQIGSLFAASAEASCHEHFKAAIVAAGEGDTRLVMKKLIPVRLLRNPFATQITEMENKGSGVEALLRTLGKGRAKSGMFDGNMDEGELEIGQVSLQIETIKPVSEIMKTLIAGFKTSIDKMHQLNDNILT